MDFEYLLEAPPRFELGNKGFADLRLTTWLWRRRPACGLLSAESCPFCQLLRRHVTGVLSSWQPACQSKACFQSKGGFGERRVPAGSPRRRTQRSHVPVLVSAGRKPAFDRRGGILERRPPTYAVCRKRSVRHSDEWSGRRDSDSRPQPWQGCALPTELLPHTWCLGAELNHRHADFQSAALPTELPRLVATRKGLEPSTSSVTGWHSNQLNYRATCGGSNRARTCDPLLVRQMLSQLSYAPLRGPRSRLPILSASCFFVKRCQEVFLFSEETGT